MKSLTKEYLDKRDEKGGECGELNGHSVNSCESYGLRQNLRSGGECQSRDRNAKLKSERQLQHKKSLTK